MIAVINLAVVKDDKKEEVSITVSGRSEEVRTVSANLGKAVQDTLSSMIWRVSPPGNVVVVEEN